MTKQTPSIYVTENKIEISNINDSTEIIVEGVSYPSNMFKELLNYLSDEKNDGNIFQIKLRSRGLKSKNMEFLHAD